MKIKHAKGGIPSTFICLILILALCSAGIGIAAAADPIVSIKPAVKDVNVSDDFSVFIEVDPNGNAVETALLNLTYDPTKVSIIDVVMNGADFPINDRGDATTAGQITSIMGHSFTGLTTAANLAEIQMHADAAGTFIVGISGDLTKPPGDPLTPVTMNTGEVRIKSPGDSLEVTVLHPNGGESIPTGTQVQVSAHATDDDAVMSVTFYYSNNGGTNWNSIGVGTMVVEDGFNITWDTNGLDAGSNYLIRAVADDGTSTREDQSDSTFSLTCTPPSTPTLNDPGTTDTDGSYTVSWSSVSGATSYTLEEDTSGSFGSPTVVYSGSGTSTQITDRADGTYYYRVNACNACGCGGWSNVEDIVVDIPSGNIITVDDSGGADYTTIQEAVDNAAGGYTIKVFSGTYNEHVVMDKSLKLIGEDKNTTIVDGSGSGNCINITADNIEISGFTIKNYIHGVYVNSSDGLIIDNNMLLNNDSCGIFMRYSSNNTLSNNYFGKICLFASSNNTLSNNDLYGISLCYSSNNVLVSNTASNNDLRGICLDHSSNNVLDSNTASNNRYDGILMVASSSNLLSNNTLSNNGFRGIRMFYSSNNVLASNTASNNWYGIYLEGSSSSNLIYHNNVIDNYNPAYDDIGTNQWDNGYPVGGNYWSDYIGIDTFSGVDQNVLGSDGIGDTHYGISGGAGAYDRYPFMNKGGWIDEENMSPVASLTYSPLNPAVDQTVAFDSSSSYDQDGQIVNCQLDLGDETVVDGLLPTTIIVYEYSSAGSYTVTLTVTDNDGAFGTETKSIIVTTSLKGDLNHDNQITPADAAIALRLAASGGWDSAADVDGDNQITSLDALMILQAAGDAIDL